MGSEQSIGVKILANFGKSDKLIDVKRSKKLEDALYKNKCRCEGGLVGLVGPDAGGWGDYHAEVGRGARGWRRRRSEEDLEGERVGPGVQAWAG